MSFFDDDDPPTRTARPRRPAASRPAAGARAASGPQSGGGGSSPEQQLLIRRAVALGLGVLLLIILVIGVKSCRTSARKNSLRDFNRDTSALIRESDKDVGQSFFSLFGTDSSPVELETQINQFRVRAEDEADRAKNLSVPGDMVAAQRNLLLVLNLRAEALGGIANRIRTARSDGNGAPDATTQIAGQMQKFLASDVIHSQRVVPLVKQELDDNEITGQEVASSSFLPNLGWLDPATVAKRIGGRASSGAGAKGGPVAPGLHGHGLTSVKVGAVELQPSPTPNRIPAGANVAFAVSFANQGTNDESDVDVKIRVTGGGKPITVTKSVTQTRAGANADISVPLGQAPPIGTPVTIQVTVGAVPGEKKTDNNKQSYTAIFTR